MILPQNIYQCKSLRINKQKVRAEIRIMIQGVIKAGKKDEEARRAKMRDQSVKAYE